MNIQRMTSSERNFPSVSSATFALLFTAEITSYPNLKLATLSDSVNFGNPLLAMSRLKALTTLKEIVYNF